MTSNEPPNDLKYSNDLKYPKWPKIPLITSIIMVDGSIGIGIGLRRQKGFDVLNFESEFN